MMRTPRLTKVWSLVGLGLMALVIGILPVEARAPLPTVGRAASERFVAELVREIQLPELVLTANDRLVFSVTGMPLMEAKTLDDFPATKDTESPIRSRVKQVRLALWAVSGREPPTDLAAAVKKLREGQNGNLSQLPTSYRFPENWKVFLAQLQQDSRSLARQLSILTEALEDLEADDRPGETESRRWVAHRDLVHAMLLLQIAQIYEWQGQVGMLRREFPDLDRSKFNGWQLVRVPTLTGDTVGKRCNQQARKILENISREYPGTPWDSLAQRLAKAPAGLHLEPMK